MISLDRASSDILTVSSGSGAAQQEHNTLKASDALSHGKSICRSHLAPPSSDIRRVVSRCTTNLAPEIDVGLTYTSTGLVFLHLAEREPEIRFYAQYAGAFSIVMSAIGLFSTRRVYRKAVTKGAGKNTVADSATVTESAVAKEKVELVWEDEKPSGNKLSEGENLLPI
ncbi:hypothetical protein HYDPIDRAFT_43013 [Hydnomerulius pinastri MD-312]|uniref:Uncharacterized protein n=1 Tax=Hydnomerulius pinastri MD-312 TaxID=994086 RepID=A0A0C9WAV9_9AGAM|nr:hypothetical protein HYDPIDRAFT_43280 [Hydnomerulius pinastri MD-312]KIJ60950.1 hypothetical protein HYDPIDRAFT_43013 [Hydnomerulius pinastri MD-312]